MKAAMKDFPVLGSVESEWIRTFALLPTFTYDDGLVWLCYVWKRLIRKPNHIAEGPKHWWQYCRFR